MHVACHMVMVMRIAHIATEHHQKLVVRMRKEGNSVYMKKKFLRKARSAIFYINKFFPSGIHKIILR